MSVRQRVGDKPTSCNRVEEGSGRPRHAVECPRLVARNMIYHQSANCVQVKHNHGFFKILFLQRYDPWNERIDAGVAEVVLLSHSGTLCHSLQIRLVSRDTTGRNMEEFAGFAFAMDSYDYCFCWFLCGCGP